MLRHVGKRKEDEPALLQCEGEPSCGKWVEHRLSCREVAIGNNMTRVFYRCTRCGRERVWGAE